MITRTNEYCGTSIYQLAPDFLDAVGRGITGQKSVVLAFEESEGTSIANLLNIRRAKMQLKLFSNHNHVSNKFMMSNGLIFFSLCKLNLDNLLPYCKDIRYSLPLQAAILGASYWQWFDSSEERLLESLNRR